MTLHPFDSPSFGPSDEAALLNAVTHGPVADAPPDALPVRDYCRCPESIAAEDEDGGRYCFRCTRAIR